MRKKICGNFNRNACVWRYDRVLTLPIAMLSMRSLHSATVLYSNSYYTVVASIFLVSTASCKAICGVASVRTSDYSQPFWLKWHALLMPHMLIKYAHVLICISAGKGSRHFSAFHLFIYLLTLTRVGGGLQYLVGLCVCLSVTTKLLFKLNYLKIWTCYSSESLQRVSNPALLQGWQILEGRVGSDYSKIRKL